MSLDALLAAVKSANVGECESELAQDGLELNTLIEGKTLLVWAMLNDEANSVKVMKALLSAGADVHAADADGNTVVHLIFRECVQIQKTALLKYQLCRAHHYKGDTENKAGKKAYEMPGYDSEILPLWDITRGMIKHVDHDRCFSPQAKYVSAGSNDLSHLSALWWHRFVIMMVRAEKLVDGEDGQLHRQVSYDAPYSFLNVASAAVLHQYAAPDNLAGYNTGLHYFADGEAKTVSYCNMDGELQIIISGEKAYQSFEEALAKDMPVADEFAADVSRVTTERHFESFLIKYPKCSEFDASFKEAVIAANDRTAVDALIERFNKVQPGFSELEVVHDVFWQGLFLSASDIRRLCLLPDELDDFSSQRRRDFLKESGANAEAGEKALKKLKHAYACILMFPKLYGHAVTALRDGIKVCPNGVGGRINKSCNKLFAITHFPENLDELLYLYRTSRLEELETWDHYYTDIHVNNRLVSLAAVAFGVKSQVPGDRNKAFSVTRHMRTLLKVYRGGMRFHALHQGLLAQIILLCNYLGYEGERTARTWPVLLMEKVPDATQAQNYPGCYIHASSRNQINFVRRSGELTGNNKGGDNQKPVTREMLMEFCPSREPYKEVEARTVPGKVKNARDRLHLPHNADESYGLEELKEVLKLLCGVLSISEAELRQRFFKTTYDEHFCSDIVQSIDFDQVSVLLRDIILREKLFESEYVCLAARGIVSMYLPKEGCDDEDVLDFFKSHTLSLADFRYFYCALEQHVKVTQVLKDRLLHQQAASGNGEHCQYLMSLGAQIKSISSKDPLVTNSEVDILTRFHEKTLSFREYYQIKYAVKSKGGGARAPKKAWVYHVQQPRHWWRSKQTPLMAAVSSGNEVLVEQFLKAGAVTNQANADGWTALHEVALLSHRSDYIAYRILNLLLDHGGDVLARVTGESYCRERDSTPSDFAPTSSETRRRLLLVEWQFAVASGDPARRERVLKKNVSILFVKSKALLPNLEKSSAEQKIAATKAFRQYEAEVQGELDQITRQQCRQDFVVNELLEMQLLSHGQVYAGYTAPESYQPIQKMVIALLQGARESYALYGLERENNKQIPPLWDRLVSEILAAAGVEASAVVNQANVDKVCQALQIKYADKNLSIFAVCHLSDGQSITVGDAQQANCRLNICQSKTAYLLVVPAETCLNDRMQVVTLFQALMSQGDGIAILARARIRSLFNNSLSGAKLEQLSSLFSDERACFKGYVSFRALMDRFQADFAAAGMDVSQEPGLAPVIFALDRLIAIEKAPAAHDFEQSELEGYFGRFLHKYLETLKQLSNDELLARRSAITRKDDSAEQGELRKRIIQLEKDAEETKSRVLKDREAVAAESSRLEKATQLQHQLQDKLDADLHDIEQSIKRLAQTVDEKKQALKDAEAKQGEGQTQANTAAQNLADHEVKLRALEKTRDNLQVSRAEVEDQLQAITREQEKLNADHEQKNADLKLAERFQRESQEVLDKLSALQDYVEQVSSTLSANADIFTSHRKDIREKLEKLKASDKSFKDIYCFLTESADGGLGIVSLADEKIVKLVEADDDKVVEFRQDLLDTIEEVFATPDYRYNDNTRTFEFHGHNVSWSECQLGLRSFVDTQLLGYGLALQDDKLVVSTNEPRVEDLPARFALVIKRAHKAKKRRDQREHPHDSELWSDVEEGSISADTIKHLSLSFNDIVHCFVGTVEVVAGRNLYVESPITLPGVDLVLSASDDIHLAKNLHIKTSQKTAPSLAKDRARSGEDYASDEKANGSPGEHGLHGMKGFAAGHITLHASGGVIHNLDTLSCEARGGDGSTAQAGGHGGQGKAGELSKDANPDDVDKADDDHWYNPFTSPEPSRTHFAKSVAPGLYDPAEVSKKGGAGGKAGLGGCGGAGGEIRIIHEHHTIRVSDGDLKEDDVLGTGLDKRFLIASGDSGADAPVDAKGGKPGEAGYYGFSKIKRRIQVRESMFLGISHETTFKYDEAARDFDYEKCKAEQEERYNRFGLLARFFGISPVEEKDGKDVNYEKMFGIDRDIWPPLLDAKEQSADVRSICQEKHQDSFGQREKGEEQEQDTHESAFESTSYRQSLLRTQSKHAEVHAIKRAQKRTERRNKRYQADVQAQADRIVQANTALAEISSQIKQASAKHEQKTADLLKINQELEQAQSDIDRIREEGGEVAQAHLAAMDAARKLFDDLSRAQQAAREAAIDLEAEQGVKQTVTAEYAKVNQRLSARMTEILADLTQMNSSLSTEQSHYQQLMTQLEALRGELSAWQRQAENRQQQVAEIDSRRATMQQQAEAQETTEQAITTQVEVKPAQGKSELGQMSFQNPELPPLPDYTKALASLVEVSQKIQPDCASQGVVEILNDIVTGFDFSHAEAVGFLKALIGGIEQSPPLSLTAITQLWTALSVLSGKDMPEAVKTLFLDVVFAAHEASVNAMLQAAKSRLVAVAAEQGQTEQVDKLHSSDRVNALRQTLDQIFYPSKPVTGMDAHGQIAYRQAFFEAYFTDPAMLLVDLKPRLSKLPPLYAVPDDISAYQAKLNEIAARLNLPEGANLQAVMWCLIDRALARENAGEDQEIDVPAQLADIDAILDMGLMKDWPVGHPFARLLTLLQSQYPEVIGGQKKAFEALVKDQPEAFVAKLVALANRLNKLNCEPFTREARSFAVCLDAFSIPGITVARYFDYIDILLSDSYREAMAPLWQMLIARVRVVDLPETEIDRYLDLASKAFGLSTFAIYQQQVDTYFPDMQKQRDHLKASKCHAAKWSHIESAIDLLLEGVLSSSELMAVPDLAKWYQKVQKLLNHAVEIKKPDDLDQYYDSDIQPMKQAMLAVYESTLRDVLNIGGDQPLTPAVLVGQLTQVTEPKTLNELLPVMTFWLKHVTTMNDDWRAVEKAIAVLKNQLCLSDNTHWVIQMTPLVACLDDYFDARSHEKVAGRLAEMHQHLFNLRITRQAAENALTRFHHDYVDADGREHKGKKALLKLLLQSLADLNIPVPEKGDLSTLIQLRNTANIERLQEMACFEGDWVPQAQQGAFQALSTAIKSGDIEGMMQAWMPVLAVLIAELQKGKIPAWTDRFMTDATSLFRMLLLEDQELQVKLSHQCGDFFQKVSYLIRDTQQTPAQRETLFACERFAGLLTAAMYKRDLYQNIDVLASEQQLAQRHACQAQVVRVLDQEVIPWLLQTVEMQRDLDAGDQSRSDLFDAVLAALGTAQLTADPQAMLNEVSQAISAVSSRVVPDTGKDYTRDYFTSAFGAIQTDVAPAILRQHFARLAIQLSLAEDLTSIDLLDLLAWVQANARHWPERFAGPLFVTLVARVLDKLPEPEGYRQQQLHQALVKLHKLTPGNPWATIDALAVLQPAIDTGDSHDALTEVLKADKKTDLAAALISEIQTEKERGDAAVLLSWRLRYYLSLLPFTGNPVAVIQVVLDSLAPAIREKKAGLFERTLWFLLQSERVASLIETYVRDEALVERLSQLSVRLCSRGGKPEDDLRCTAVIDGLAQHIETSGGKPAELMKTLVQEYGNDAYLLEAIHTPEEWAYAQRIDSASRKKVLAEQPDQKWLSSYQHAYWEEVIAPTFYQDVLNRFKDVAVLNEKLPEFKERWPALVNTHRYTELRNLYALLIEPAQASSDKDPEIEAFAESLESLYRFKTQLTVSYSIARHDGAESTWLMLLDGLMQAHKAGIPIADCGMILSLANYVSDWTRFANLVVNTAPQQMCQAVLVDLVEEGIHHRIVQSKGNDVDIQALRGPQFDSPMGRKFLTILAKALKQGDQVSHVMQGADFQHVLKQLIAIKVNQDSCLLDDLKARPIQYWPAVIRRRELSIRLRLSRGNPDHDRLFESLLSLQQAYGSEVVEKWVNKILLAQEPLDRKALADIFERFRFQEWAFDNHAFELIQNETPDKWFGILDKHLTVDMSTAAAELKISDLITKLRSDPQTTKALGELIEEVPGRETCLLEDLLEQIREQAREKLGFDDILNRANTKFRKKAGDKGRFLHEGGRGNGDYAELVSFLATVCMAYEDMYAEKDPGRSLRNTQLIALIGFLTKLDREGGRLGNISTGEGKTHITQALAIACALRGETVYVTTSSKALAKPNAEEAETFLKYFGVTVSNNCDEEAEADSEVRMKRYAENEVIYGELDAFERDHLMTTALDKPIQPNGGYRLIADEADAAMIDNAQKVLYISHDIYDFDHLRGVFMLIWMSVNSSKTMAYSKANVSAIRELYDSKIDDKTISIPPDLASFIDRHFEQWVESAYQAKQLDEQVEYSIMRNFLGDTGIIINDLGTGVEQMNARWGNGLHAFVELKHRRALSRESLRAVYESNVTYIQRFQGRIFGLSGTLGEDAEQQLYKDVYKADTFVVPRFRGERIRQYPPTVCPAHDSSWVNEIVDEVHERTGGATEVDPAVLDAAKANHAKVQTEAASKEQDLAALSKELERHQDRLARLDERLVLIPKLISSISAAKLNGQLKSAEDLAKEKSTLDDERKRLESERPQIQARCTDLKETLRKDAAKLRLLKQDEQDQASVMAGCTGQPVLVICGDKRSAESVIEALESSASLQQKIKSGKVRIIPYTSYVEGFEKAGQQLQPGDIVVATNIAGRGTDLELSKTAIANGGLHTVTGLLGNVRIEKQAIGRGGRKGQPASYRFIVKDSRCREKNDIPFSLLVDERNERERTRLAKLSTVEIPALKISARIFERYRVFQEAQRLALKNQKLPEKFITLQIKSLQDRWAFWRDEHEPEFQAAVAEGTDALDAAYAAWEAKTIAECESNVDLFVKSAGEYQRLGHYYLDCGRSVDAKRCFDRVIELNPDFSGFAHYYKAQAIIAGGSSGEEKKEARRCLKEAVKCFDQRMEMLSTHNQILQALSKRDEKLGKGLHPDGFTKRNNDEIGVFQIHKNAAQDAMGYELNEDRFERTGEMDKQEAKQVLDLLTRSCDKVIKGLRLSMKTSIETVPETSRKGLFYDKRYVPLPAEFRDIEEEVCKEFKWSVGQKEHQARRIDLGGIAELVLTTDRWVEALVKNKQLVKQGVLSLSKDFEEMKLLEAPWSDDLLAAHASALKKALAQGVKDLSREDLVASLKERLPKADLSWEAVVDMLVEHDILEKGEAYHFSDEAKAKLAEMRESFTILPLSDVGKYIDALPLFKSPELRSLAPLIYQRLHEAVKKEEKTLKRTDFQVGGEPISEAAFVSLYEMLYQQGLIDCDAVDRLGMTLPKPGHRRMATERLIALADVGAFSAERIDLPTDAGESAARLGQYLVNQGVAKGPKVFFPETTRSDSRIDQMLDDVYDAVSACFDDIVSVIERVRPGADADSKAVADWMVEIGMENLLSSQKASLTEEQRKRAEEEIKRRKNVAKLRDALKEALKDSVGTLRNIGKVKLENKDLDEFFKGKKVPPVVVDYMRQCCDSVLALVEDVEEDSCWWDCLICALIGICQVVAGVLLAAAVPGVGVYFAKMLINEGIGDIAFAATSYANGNFSWEAYGQHKLQSLAVSLIATGVAASIATEKDIFNLGKTISTSVAKEIVKAGVTVAIDVSINQALSTLADTVMNNIFNEFRDTFVDKVKQQAHSAIEKVKASLRVLHQKLGASAAEIQLNAAKKELDLSQVVGGAILSEAGSMVKGVMGKLAQFRPESGAVATTPLEMVAKIANIARYVLQIEAFRESYQNILNTSAGLFDQLSIALERRASTRKQQEGVTPLSGRDLADAVDESVDQVAGDVLKVIQQQVMQTVKNVGGFALNEVFSSLMEKTKQGISESISDLLDVNTVETAGDLYWKHLDNKRVLAASEADLAKRTTDEPQPVKRDGVNEQVRTVTEAPKPEDSEEGGAAKSADSSGEAKPGVDDEKSKQAGEPGRKVGPDLVHPIFEILRFGKPIPVVDSPLDPDKVDDPDGGAPSAPGAPGVPGEPPVPGFTDPRSPSPKYPIWRFLHDMLWEAVGSKLSEGMGDPIVDGKRAVLREKLKSEALKTVQEEKAKLLKQHKVEHKLVPMPGGKNAAYGKRAKKGRSFVVGPGGRPMLQQKVRVPGEKAFAPEVAALSAEKAKIFVQDLSKFGMYARLGSEALGFAGAVVFDLTFAALVQDNIKYGFDDWGSFAQDKALEYSIYLAASAVIVLYPPATAAAVGAQIAAPFVPVIRDYICNPDSAPNQAYHSAMAWWRERQGDGGGAPSKDPGKGPR